MRRNKENNANEWLRDGVLHRDDGPAVVYDNGISIWYKNGKIHREGGPAVYDKFMEREKWYYEDQLHRLDGPAVTMTVGESWYFHGTKIHWKDACQHSQFLLKCKNIEIKTKTLEQQREEFFAMFVNSEDGYFRIRKDKIDKMIKK